MEELMNALHIPKQLAAKAEQLLGGSDMKASISSYPPLGQVTILPQATTTFTVLLEVDESRILEPWEVAVWYTKLGSEWIEHPLLFTEHDASSKPFTVRQATTSPDELSPLYFTGVFPIAEPVTFTIKFRAGPEKQWKWVKDQQGMQDGTVLVKPDMITMDRGDKLDLYVKGLNSELEAKQVMSQSPDTMLWSVIAKVEAAKGEESTIKDMKLGYPWGKFRRWFALVRLWSPWLAPRHGKESFKLDRQGVLCSFLSDSGQHMVLLAISGVDNVMTLFESDDEGNVMLKIRNDSDKDAHAHIAVAIGNDFDSAHAAVMYQARSIVAGYERASGEEQKEIKAMIDGVKPQWMENWFDGLTYCTWNGLGQRLTEDAVIKAVDTLSSHNINITNLIIDDNWQALDYRGHGQFQHGWKTFEADPETFPSGLAHTVRKIRSQTPNIEHIAVWHAILGYWGGLAPDGELAKTYKTIETVRDDAERRNLPLGGKMTVVAKEDVQKFYNDFYSFLSSAGIDAVKTDAQFMLDTLVSAKDRRELINTYLDAWTISSLRYFSIKAISCMSQTPHILFHSQMPQNKPTVLVRNSDDFFPEIESSHPWHIFCNAHNSLFTQYLNLLPDWDMFQTVHDYSSFHAAARAVSGGPIYITDVPGQHDIPLIAQMTAQTIQNKTIILRPSNVGKSLTHYTGYTDEVLLKVGTYHGYATTGTGIIGVFNVSSLPLTELIPLSLLPGVVEAQYYIIRNHSTGNVSEIMQVVSPEALIDISLPVRGWEILSSYPLRGFVQSEENPRVLEGVPSHRLVEGLEEEEEDVETWIAVLGLLGKMTGAAGVLNSYLTMDEGGKVECRVALKALGVLGIYISDLAKRTVEEHFLVMLRGEVVPVECVRVGENGGGRVLEIDVEGAWKKMGLKAGWGNEVEVRVFVMPRKG